MYTKLPVNKLLIYTVAFTFLSLVLYYIFFVSNKSINNPQNNAQPYTRTETLMDTFITIKLWNVTEEKASNLFMQTFNALSLIEKLASFHFTNSELSKLNTQNKLITSLLFGYLILITDKIVRETNGYFDPTIASLYELYGNLQNANIKLPSAQEIQAILQTKVGWLKNIKIEQIDATNLIPYNALKTSYFDLIFCNNSFSSFPFYKPQNVFGISIISIFDALIKSTLSDLKLYFEKILKQLSKTFISVNIFNDAKIDLGGIAGGFAVDLAAEILRLNGCNTFFIDDGGDILVDGQKPDKTEWKIGVKDPTNNGIVAIVKSNKPFAISTSGDYERYIVIEGVRINHIFNPFTGVSANNFRSVTVIASSSLYADVWSTALFAMPQQIAYDISNKNNIPALFITYENELYINNAGKNWFFLSK